MRNIVAAIVVLIMTLGGCVNVEAGTIQGKTVGLILSTLENPFFGLLRDGAVEEAANRNLSLIVKDSRDDSQLELLHVKTLLDQHISVLLINPVNSVTVRDAIRLANQHNVPVITLDRRADEGDVAAHIAPDNVSGGKMLGEILASKMHYKGNLIEIEGIPGTSATVDRSKGLRQAIHDTAITLVTHQPADFNRVKGKALMTTLLKQYPDVNAVFAHNDEMALGALDAIHEANRKDILVAGYDASQEAIDSVRAGGLVATVAQQPGLMGKYGVDTAIKIMLHEPIRKQIPVQLKLLARG